MQGIRKPPEVSAVRPGRSLSIALASALAVLVAVALPIAAQEEFPGADPERPLSGYTRGDGTIVLDDASYCRYLLTAALGDERLTYVSLLDKSKKQKKARSGAFAAASDEEVLARCEEALAAFRSEEGTEAEAEPAGADALPGWARRAPVVPQALAALLPSDFVAQPLASADEIGPAARTSGFGDVVSAPFSVTPGPWLAELDASGCDSWSGTLRDARDPERSFELAGTREYLYELEAGHYYWDVSSSACDWSVDLVPVVLGPEPTPTPEPRAVVPALFGPEWNRYPDAPNADWLTPALAREGVFAAGLTTGACVLDDSPNRGNRVWRQEPVAGTLVDFGTPVDVWAGADCDIYLGERVELE